MKALLFDLDETLIHEQRAIDGAFAATAALAVQHGGVEPSAFVRTARQTARELWAAGPHAGWCERVGISSSEGLCCGFAGPDRHLLGLRAWAQGYRREVWRRALDAQGVENPELEVALAARFRGERLRLSTAQADVLPALRGLRGKYALAVVTNGASCLQREKLEASMLGSHFRVVVVSAEVGVGKPDPRVLLEAARRLGCQPGQAVVIGDNPATDIAAARPAGMRAVLLDRGGRQLSSGLASIQTLRALPAALAALER